MKNRKEIAVEISQSENAKGSKSGSIALNISATFTAEPVQDTIAFWFDYFGWDAQIHFSPYNQVFQSFLNESTATQFDAHVVFLRLEDWINKEHALDANPLNGLESVFQDFVEALRFRRSLESAAIFVVICPPSSAYQNQFHDSYQENLVGILNDVEDVYPIRFEDILDVYPVEEYLNPHADAIGNIPYTQDFFTAVGTMISRKISALKQSPLKVVVLDCDNTLWGGVCGEDGTNGIVLDEGRLFLQKFFLDKADEGILLCLCSKNNEQDVIEVFQNRDDMQISWSDITASKINWLPKSANLKSLSEELQLGLDSFLFIDDSPVECEEVRTNCPEVITLQLPESSAAIQSFLESIWVLDKLNITKEDQKRAAFYKQNVKREQIRSQAMDLRSFLDQLQIKIDISKPTTSQIARVAQLTQRTNQFNTTTVRRSDADIQQILEEEHSSCLVVHVQDKFGDYGLVGAAIYSVEKDSLIVDSLMLSCRALGREVEYKMVQSLGQIAGEKEISQIAIRFSSTPKNKPALQFLEGLEGIRKEEDDTGISYLIPTSQAQKVTFQQTKLPSSSEGEAKESIEIVRESEKNISLSERSLLHLEVANTLQSVNEIGSRVEKFLQNERVEKVDYIEPRTPAEKKLARMWERVLKVDRVGVNDNFVELGGDSLKGTLLLADIQLEFDVELPLISIFEISSLGEMSSRIQMLKIESVGMQDIQDALAELGELSESEILKLLNEDASN